MTEPPANEVEKLRLALAGLEAQRGILGEAVEPALELVRRQIAALEAQAAPPPAQAQPADDERRVADERRIVTILFTDIVGSTALAERMDPEDWRRIVAQIHAMAGEQVTQHQGTVVQYLGDGLLALFGAQSASEADPENAVRAALGIQAGLGGLPLDPPVQMRAGVHSGLVVIGDLGSQAHRELTATGDAMNLAARLQSAAPPGGVLVSHEVYRQVRGSFAVTPQPPLSVKGKSEPVQTYLVRHARERLFHSTPRGVAGVETRTVGREAELAQLQAAYRLAYEQRQVVWAQLVGEAGVGKSRLMDDLREWLDLRPERLRVLRGRAYAGDAGQPLSLVRRMWFERFRITEDEPLASAEEKWVRAFQELGRTDEVEPAQALGLLVGLPFSGSPHLEGMRGDPAQVKGRAYVVSRELLQGVRRRQAMVIYLEDLHWVDAASLEYLVKVAFENSLQAGEDLHGLFVLATARPDWQPPASLAGEGDARARAYRALHIQPLSPAASRELAGELLGRVEGVSEAVVELIVERAEGVPYYAEELVNLLIDRGVIDQSAERWRFIADRLDTGQLPLTLQHLLLTRLLSLPPTERTCLQHSAIFGRNFWEGGLEALGTPAPHGRLAPLQPRGFVEQQAVSSFGNTVEWSFHHALQRDVTYESVLKRDRTGLHKAAAAWLEAQARQAGRLSEFAGVLGEHAERAGDLPAAADWYLQAGERAKDLGATREARGYFERALGLLAPSDRERRWRALLGRSDTLGLLGDQEPRRANLEALLELALELDDARQAEAWYRQGNLQESLGDYPAAFVAYDAALRAAEQAGDRRLKALVLAIKVIGQNRLGEAEAAVHAQAVLDLKPQLDEKSAMRVSNNLAVYYLESGDLAKAAHLHKEAADQSQALGDRSTQANALTNLGYGYTRLGEYPQARAALDQALGLCRAIDARREGDYVLLNLGLAHWREGDSLAARRAFEQATSDLQAINDAFGVAAGFSYLGLACEQAGDWAEAQERYHQAMQQFKGMGIGGYATDALAGLARCALARGEPEQARQQAEQVWRYVQEQGSQGMEFPIWGFLTCAQVFEALGEREKMQAAVELGCQELQQRAGKISDPDWRQSFLENVPEHRRIWGYQGGASAAP